MIWQHSCVFDTCNKKMSLVPFTFKNVELKVVTINGKPWTRVKEVRKALKYNKKTAHVIRAHCSRENYAHKYDLTSVPTAGAPVNWPKDSIEDSFTRLTDLKKRAMSSVNLTIFD